jgi:hypothetical protein
VGAEGKVVDKHQVVKGQSHWTFRQSCISRVRHQSD